jgi:phosphatidylserine decarboxylase
MGVIRLGSQVDVVMPAIANLKVLVKPGDRVRAGEFILAVLEGEFILAVLRGAPGVLG